MEDQEARLRALQEELYKVESLLENVGWQEMIVLGQEQMRLRLPRVLKKLDNVLEISAQEFEKGEIAGIELFCALPGIRSESIKEDIKVIEEELGYAPGESGSTEDSGDSGDGEFQPPI